MLATPLLRHMRHIDARAMIRLPLIDAAPDILRFFIIDADSDIYIMPYYAYAMP